jgi:NAD(P)-dependent dehydrogenase (short-subunit alcohol dehydrogenase family)
MPTVLITGGHTGIGLECAKQLASGPHLNILLAGRDLNRVQRTAIKLRADYGVAVTALKLDVSSLSSVRAASAQCRAMLDSGAVDSLQAILCNAGAQFQGPVSYSVDGYEETFATNCLGHFLLLELLIDRVADQGRVVFTASGTHDPETMDGKVVGAAVEPDAQALAFDGKNGAKPLSGGKRYTTSKLCAILYAYELDRRLRAHHSSVASIAFDPGFIPETGLVRTSPKPVQWLMRTSLMKWVLKRLGVTMGSVSFSGAGLAKVVADPSFAHSSGKYIQSNSGSLIEARSSKMSYDGNRAHKLWADSKQLVKLQPNEESVLLQ